MTTTRLRDEDQSVFAEVAKVLERHGALDRFGLVLKHQHFQRTGDEVVHEMNDHLGRISLRRIVREEDLPEDAFATEWSLDAQGGAHAIAWCCD